MILQKKVQNMPIVPSLYIGKIRREKTVIFFNKLTLESNRDILLPQKICSKTAPAAGKTRCCCTVDRHLTGSVPMFVPIK